MKSQDKARRFCKTARQYLPYSVHNGIVKKVFNKGQGALALYRFGTSNIVTVNTSLECKSDRRRLEDMFPGIKCYPDSLGYPEWYFRTLTKPGLLSRKHKHE